MPTTGGVTLTGMDELKRDVERFPEDVRRNLRNVARSIALRIRNRARQLVRVDTGITRDSIGVMPDLENNQYIVSVVGAPHHRRSGRTANFPMLPIWIEYGTRFLRPQPFIRPAADEHEDAYRRETEGAVANTPLFKE